MTSKRKGPPPRRPTTAEPPARAEPAPVTTGLLFVRFREGIRAEDQAAALASAGFEIERVPPWAPHAAWLRPRTGGGADPDRLSGLPDVEHVEPQILVERAQR